MTHYISILRGINVGGKKRIKMDVLRQMYESLGFCAVKSYVQSGNIIFTDTVETETPEELAAVLTQKIKQEFDLDVPVLVLSQEKWKRIMDNNPFLAEKNPMYLHVTFLASKPNVYPISAMEAKKQVSEEMAFTDDAIYLYCPNGYAKTKLSNNFIETKLKVVATTRNWKTVQELWTLLP